MDTLFSFEDMTGGSGRAKYTIARLFAKYRAPTASEGQSGGGGKSVEIDPKLRRAAGITYRDVHVAMKDSQKVTFRVKQTGDIFQVLVNGKAVPIKSQHSQADAIREIVDVLNARRARVQKALANARVPMRRGASVSTRMQVNQLKAKIVGLDEMIADAQMELAEIAGPEVTPFAESAPVPSAAEMAAEAPATEPVAAEQAATVAEVAPEPAATEVADDGMGWLRDIIAGTTDVSEDLKGFRDRIRAAQKVPESAELANQASRKLAEVVLEVAKAKLGGAQLDAAEEPNEGVALDSARKMNQKGYQFYVVSNGKIESGWDYREDAAEHLKENMPAALRAGAKVLQARGLNAAGLDANDNAFWLSSSDNAKG